MDPQTPAAPAPTIPTPPAPPSISPSMAAVEKGDFSAFQDADDARRRGTPLPPVEVEIKKADAAPAPEAPVVPVVAPTPEAPPAPAALSKRQQEANERTRLAVERATADLQARVKELEGRLTPPTEPKAQPTQAEWRRYLAMPDAPRLDAVDAHGNAVFASVDEHSAAMALFVADKRAEERAHAQREEQFHTQRQRFLQERGETFTTKLQAAAEADPDFLDKIPPEVATARPLSGCVRDPHGRLVDPTTRRPPTFANVAAEAAFRSDTPDKLLTYLHAHPQEVDAIVARPSADWLPALIHLDGRLSGPLTPAAPAAPAPAAVASPAPPISAAPPPPPSVSRAGSMANPSQVALERGDYDTFSKLEDAARAAKRRASA